MAIDVVKAHFNPNQLRDPKTGEWINTNPNWPSSVREAFDEFGNIIPANVRRSNARGPVGTVEEAKALGMVGPFFHGTSKRRAQSIRRDGFRQPRLADWEMTNAGTSEEVDFGHTHRTYFAETRADAESFARGHHGDNLDIVEAYIHPDYIEREGGGGFMPSVRSKEVRHIMAIKRHRREIRKGFIPLWDGDGVQGAGQPRDRVGRWIRLPGASALKSILAKELHNGEYGIFHDDNHLTPVRTVKTKGAANAAVSRAIKTDVHVYLDAKKETQNAKRRLAGARRSHLAAQKVQQERTAQIVGEQARQKRTVGVPSPSGSKRRPAKVARTVTVSPLDRLEHPGTPSQAQADAAAADARKTLPPNEAKYAGLIIRLLKNRGITQDPAQRQKMSQRYGIPASRLIQIEQHTYQHMFPKKSSRRPNLGGGAPMTDQQAKEMVRLGARKGTPEPDPTDAAKPSRYFKINKGPDRGKWGKVSWNGTSEVVSDKEAQTAISQSKVEWTRRMLSIGAQRKRKALKYRAEQDALKFKAQQDAEELKAFKIAEASKWAEGEGLDPTDTYWHAFFWNDPSLLREQTGEETSKPMSVGLSEKMKVQHMDPKILEGILAMPDISSHEMRGHKPDRNPKPHKGEPGFIDASPEARTNDPAHEAANMDRSIKHNRRVRMAFDKYKKAHPASQMSLEQFTESYYNNKLRIPGGKRDIRKAHFDPHEPRDFHGRWVKLPGKSLFNKIGIWEHTDGTHGVYVNNDKLLSSHKTLSAATKVVEEIRLADIGSSRTRRTGNPWDHIKFKPLQRGKPHKALGVNGRPLAKVDYTPEQAAYLRNHGSTKITDTRLKELHRDRSLATRQERDLLLSAAVQKHIDGDNPVQIWIKNKRITGKRPRYSVMSDIAKEMVNDDHRKSGGTRGEGGQVVRLLGERHTLRRKKDNQKNIATGRSKWESVAKRQNLLDQFGDGKHATCVLCGDRRRRLTLSSISPERIRPGGQDQSYGGVYEHGNVAPSHYECNTGPKAKKAQYEPEQYFLDNLIRMLRIYGPDSPGVKEAIKKHRAFMKRNGLV